MYPSTSSVHTKNRRWQENRTRLAKPAAASLVAPQVAPLALPSLEGIDTRRTINHGARRTAKTLLTFMDLGLVDGSDMERPWDVESEILQRAFSRWVEREGHGLELFNPSVVIGEHTEDIPDCEELADDRIVISFGVTQMEYVLIGEKTMKLETECPGLGETLLNHLYHALNSTLFSATPGTVLDLARFTYWQGEEDETFTIEEMREMGEDPDDVEFFRKSDYLAEIPEWVAEPTKKLTEQELAVLTLHKNNDVQRAAQAALDLLKATTDEAYLPPTWGSGYADCVNPAIFMRWSEQDATERVFDDYYQYVVQTEHCTDLHGVYEVTLDNEGVAQGLRQTRSLFAQLRAAEQAIKLIAT